MATRKTDPQLTRSAAHSLLTALGGRLTETSATKRGGYTATLQWPYAQFLELVESLDITLMGERWPRSVGFGLRARTRATIRITSPTRGERSGRNWGTFFYPMNIAGGLLGFGNQLAAVDANGGEITSVTLHIVCPPDGLRVRNWVIV